MVETPSYKAEKREGSFEIRTYAAYILAQVDVESDFDGALRNGFEILAYYIFGGNRKKESISMTAPVSEEKVSGRGNSYDGPGDVRKDIDDCPGNRRTSGRTCAPNLLCHAIEVHPRDASRATRQADHV